MSFILLVIQLALCGLSNTADELIASSDHHNSANTRMVQAINRPCSKGAVAHLTAVQQACCHTLLLLLTDFLVQAGCGYAAANSCSSTLRLAILKLGPAALSFWGMGYWC